MEHDIDDLLRKKILTAEQNEVQWKKKDIWLKIDEAIAPIPINRPYKWYYAAASLLLMVSFGIYYIVQQNMNKQAYMRIQSLTMALENIQKSKAISIEVQKEKCVSANTQNRFAILSKNEKAKTKYNKVKRANIKHHMLAETTTESIAVNFESVTLNDSIHNTSHEVAHKKNYVQPIIGVVIQEDEPVQIVREKKVKFKLFRSPDRYPETDDKDLKILFARIN